MPSRASSSTIIHAASGHARSHPSPCGTVALCEHTHRPKLVVAALAWSSSGRRAFSRVSNPSTLYMMQRSVLEDFCAEEMNDSGIVAVVSRVSGGNNNQIPTMHDTKSLYAAILY